LNTSLDLILHAAAAPRPVIDIRYGQVGLVQVRIRTTDPGAILDELTGRVATAPHFFQRTAVCLDLGALGKSPEVAEIRAVVDALRRAGMLAIGLAGNAADLEGVSKALNLPMLSGFRTPNAAVPTVQAALPAAVGAAAEAEAEAPAPERVPTVPARAVQAGTEALIHQQMVRSGQRIYARNRDLVVIAGVGAGAEVMADGCVHIYGSMRGRAMAGAHGQPGARVFCQEFYAELVSIAGVFRVFETIPAELAGRPVQAWLAAEDLHFARIDA